MGFLSGLWKVVTAPARLTYNVVKGAVKGVVETIDDLLSSKSDSISENIGRTESLSDVSTVQQVEDISNLLRQYRNQYQPGAETLERYYGTELKKYFDDLIEEIEQDRELANSFGFGKLQSLERRMLRKIDGSISDAISTKLSIDNSECRRILEMPKGDHRTQQMKNYVQKVIDEAKENLIAVISENLYEQTDAIADFLEKRIDERERAVAKAKADFDRWEKEIKNNAFDREREQLNPQIKLYAIERVEGIFGAKMLRRA